MEKKFESLENKHTSLRKASEEKDKKISLKMKQNTIENSVNAALTPTSKDKFKCSFSSSTEGGIKTHVSKKHNNQKAIVEKNYPPTMEYV